MTSPKKKKKNIWESGSESGKRNFFIVIDNKINEDHALTVKPMLVLNKPDSMP